MKKIIAILVVLTLVLGTVFTFSGCNVDESEPVDPNRTQLYVGVTSDGVGKAWTQTLKAAYEAENPDIQVIFDFKGDEFSSTNLVDNMPYNRQDVYFLSNFSAQSFISARGSDLVVDITDIVTEVQEDGYSIYNAMNYDPYYNWGTQENPKYYSLPYWSGAKGLIYDHDLFVEYNLYSLNEYVGIDGVDGTDDDTWGPDGTEGTYDDGMPATWEDFKILLDVMVAEGITPFTWTGQHTGYFISWIASLWASYEGANDMALNVSFQGTDSQFGEIKYSNAWKLMGQNGRYAALKVAEYIVSNPSYYTQNCFKTSHSHTNAQLEFLKSKQDGTNIAFIVEGDWWESEAIGTFDEMAAKYGEEYGYGKRNFKVMPAFKFVNSTDGIPDQEASTLTVNTLGGLPSTTNGACVINKATEKLELAKDFVQFAFSEEMNAAFNADTSIIRPFTYEMSEENLAKMTPYAKALYEFASESTTVRATTIARQPILADNYSFFSNGWYGFRCEFNGMNYAVPQNAFQQNKLTAEQYFEAAQLQFTEQKWQNALSLYLQ